MNHYSANLKARARDRLLGRYTRLVGATALIAAISYLSTALLNTVFPPGRLTLAVQLPYYVSQWIVSLLISVLTAGSCRMFLNLCRSQPYAISDLFFGFRDHPDRILVANLILSLADLLCALPAVALLLLFFRTERWLFLAAAVAAGLAGLALAVYINLCYALVPYLYCDMPDKTSRGLLAQSRALMLGCKGKLLYVCLSLAGLFLLGVLSFGIGLLWVMPYVNTTLAYFYLDASHQSAA